MKKILMFFTVILLSLALMGCNFNRDNGADNDNGTTGTETGEDNNAANEGNDTNDAGQSNLEVADEAADLVTELDEVESATVIVTDQNAYVAVVLGDNANGNTGDGADDTETGTDTGTDTDTETGDTGTDNTGTENGDNDLPEGLEEKIADKVREANTDIENVYVSLNPDFVERMTEYGTRIDEGDPVEGFFDEFTEAVQRVFPDAS